MSQKQYSILIGIIIVALIVVVVAFIQFFQIRGDDADNGLTPEEVEEDEGETGFVPDQVEAMHQIKNGRHIVAGSVDLPTPCHLLDHSVTVAESDPEQVTIEFSSRVDASVDFCAQVITPNRFKVEFEVSPEATISATFNGQVVDLNLTEVDEEEQDLDDFDVFIKG